MRGALAARQCAASSWGRVRLNTSHHGRHQVTGTGEQTMNDGDGAYALTLERP